MFYKSKMHTLLVKIVISTRVSSIAIKGHALRYAIENRNGANFNKKEYNFTSSSLDWNYFL